MKIKFIRLHMVLYYIYTYIHTTTFIIVEDECIHDKKEEKIA
jgi:hypothetical protein